MKVQSIDAHDQTDVQMEGAEGVPPGEKHQFVNDTNDKCTFICLIPAQQSCAR